MWRVTSVRILWLPAILFLAQPAALWAQPPAMSTQSVQDLQQQIAELKALVLEMRGEVSSSRHALAELQKELQQTRSLLAQQSVPAPQPETAAPAQLPAEHAEEHELLNAKVNEQHQTKVESASKYRVRLSGIVLFNMFSNAGAVDNLDFPHFAFSQQETRTNGTFGASLRQSQIGLELFGPTLWNARTSADLQLDFAGGFADTINGVSSGIVRLRTGTVRFDWPRTSVVAGQDVLFFSPLSPTSLASMAIPAFSYAGNLWSWTPQLRVQHKLDVGDHRLLLEGGVLDSLTGEPPYAGYYRTRTAGENSRQPAYAMRAAWAHGASDDPATFGVAGYYGRQDWGFDRTVDGWAAMTDWSVPLGELFKVSGEFYRGRAAGGLGAGLGRSVFYSDEIQIPTTRIDPVDTIGGWTQLKYKPTTKLEFNAAVGMDNLRASQVRAFANPASEFDSAFDPALLRNRSALINVIYRLRSNVLLSLEDRQIQTFKVDESSKTANHLSMSVGVLF